MKRLRRFLLKILIALALLFKPCTPVVAAEPAPRPVVHLEEGQAAPYSGDLVQPITLLTLASEHKKLGTMRRKLAEEEKARERDREFYQAKIDAIQLALNESEQQKVPAPVSKEDDGPGFFERPVVLLTLGVVLGGLATYGVTRL